MMYEGDVIADDGFDGRQCGNLLKVLADLGQFAEGVDVLGTFPLAI